MNEPRARDAWCAHRLMPGSAQALESRVRGYPSVRFSTMVYEISATWCEDGRTGRDSYLAAMQLSMLAPELVTGSRAHQDHVCWSTTTATRLRQPFAIAWLGRIRTITAIDVVIALSRSRGPGRHTPSTSQRTPRSRRCFHRSSIVELAPLSLGERLRSPIRDHHRRTATRLSAYDRGGRRPAESCLARSRARGL